MWLVNCVAQQRICLVCLQHFIGMFRVLGKELDRENEKLMLEDVNVRPLTLIETDIRVKRDWKNHEQKAFEPPYGAMVRPIAPVLLDAMNV